MADDAAQHNEDPLSVLIGPITRPKSKQLRQLFIGYVQRWWKPKSSPFAKDEEELKAFYNSLSADFGNKFGPNQPYYFWSSLF